MRGVCRPRDVTVVWCVHVNCVHRSSTASTGAHEARHGVRD